MPAFKDIVGHEQIIEHLQNAITMDKVSHACELVEERPRSEIKS